MARAPRTFRGCCEVATRHRVACMKMTLRVLIGVVGLVVIVLAIKQFTNSVREPSANSTPPPQKIGEMFTSVENGYSHRIPQGWESKPAPPSKAAMIAAPESSGLSSNMVTTIEPYDGMLCFYLYYVNIQSLSISAVKTIGKRAYFNSER